jgi:phenylpropionate dioxygenase-like ring-hydroxylating dioxygenase large terminal subunit
MDYQPKANWKLVCENFLDGYHLPWVHSQVGPPEAGSDYLSISISADIFGAFVPGGEKEHPRIDRPLSSFSTVADEFKGSHHFTYIFPNTVLSLGSEWMMAIPVVPRTVDESQEIFGLYLVGDESESAEMAEQRDQFGAQMVHINTQDMDVVARLQPARASPAARHCTFAPYWDELVAMFHQRIARALDYVR